jgi:hypothetical protein
MGGVGDRLTGLLGPVVQARGLAVAGDPDLRQRRPNIEEPADERRIRGVDAPMDVKQ